MELKYVSTSTMDLNRNVPSVVPMKAHAIRTTILVRKMGACSNSLPFCLPIKTDWLVNLKIPILKFQVCWSSSYRNWKLQAFTRYGKNGSTIPGQHLR